MKTGEKVNDESGDYLPILSHWQSIGESPNFSFEAHTPQSIWKKATWYFKWCDENPIAVKKKHLLGKIAGTSYIDYYPRIYTVKGLCLMCNIEESWIKDVMKERMFGDEFYNIIGKILYIIYCQNAELAAVNLINPMFASKMLGMGEESDDNTRRKPIKVEVISDGVPSLSSSENEILKKLDLEKEIFEKSE